jgi:hypothetical protein
MHEKSSRSRQLQRRAALRVAVLFTSLTLLLAGGLALGGLLG